MASWPLTAGNTRARSPVKHCENQRLSNSSAQINLNLGGLGFSAADSESFAGLFNSIKIGLSFHRPRGSIQSKIVPFFQASQQSKLPNLHLSNDQRKIT